MLGGWAYLIGCVVLIAFIYTIYNFRFIKRLPEGNETMQKIARFIREGADAFVKHEYIPMGITVIILFGVFTLIYRIECGLSFVMGAVFSGIVGPIGLRATTYGNVRVTNMAYTTRKLSKTLPVALRNGMIIGNSVHAFVIFGFLINFAIYSTRSGFMTFYTNPIGITFIPLSMILSTYALGWSIVAIFLRIGGGIFTKAADAASDLVGKYEYRIEEDDPRNAGAIADNVGDAVNDNMAMAADLGESLCASMAAVIVLAIHLYNVALARGWAASTSTLSSMMMFPVILSTVGLLGCLIAQFFCMKRKMSENPRKELNLTTWISAGLTVVLSMGATWMLFKDKSLEGFGFNLGIFSPWIAATFGNIIGMAIGKVSEYFTAFIYKPTQSIILASRRGPAMNTIQGTSVGMKSVFPSVLLMAVAFLISYGIAGFYGVACAGVGMLSYVAMTVSVDAYGPVADNAGGIAEMSKLPEDVRKITDELDSIGNETAAKGKGFAIGSASLATFGLIASFMYSFIPVTQELILSIFDPFVFAGMLIGGSIPWQFSGNLMQSVSNVTTQLVDEIRRQFREIVGIFEGTNDPNYGQCVGLATKGSLHEMVAPSILAVGVPLLSGFLCGGDFVSGLLVVCTFSAIYIAVYAGNSGGAWDNAKKAIELGYLIKDGKGSDAHAASVCGDTYGDPLKDTVGPCQDIFIKISAVVAGIFVVVFSKYNFRVLVQTNPTLAIIIATVLIAIVCIAFYIMMKRKANTIVPEQEEES